MLRIKSSLQRFRFESKEMEASYAQFQKSNEKVLLSFFNIVAIPVSIILLIIGILNHNSLQVIITRVVFTLIIITAYFLKSRYPNLQKFLLTVVTVSTIFLAISRIKFIWPNDHIKGGFIVGNTAGLMEACLILSHKDLSLKALTYLILFGIKVITLHSEFFEVPERGSISLILLIFALIFYLSDNILDRKIFKAVYESNDKLKKFQGLLSNDLPSSVVIVSLDLKEILYSNKFFETTFQKECWFLKDPIYGVEIFKKFIIDYHLSQEYESKKESIFDFLQSIDNNKSHHLNEAEFISLSAIYKDEEEKEFYYEIKLRKIIWEGINSYAMILHNVSDKQMVVSLKLADEQKDKVIATVSHELRTPINGILGLLEMVTVRTIDSLSLEYLDYAKSCSKLLLYLVNSILDLSQLRHSRLRINKEFFVLGKFLEELRSLYIFHSQQKKIEFTIERDPAIPNEIYSDKYKLIEILINLIGNAMKFTFEGYICLKVSMDQDDPQKIVFQVEDTGIGIQEKDKSKLFQMFGKIEQADRSVNTQGVGLGLTIANELVKTLNDGINAKEEKIYFESQFGKGSKFWFRINAYPQEQSDQDSFLAPINIDLTQEEQNSISLREYSPGSVNGLDRKIIQHPTLLYKKKVRVDQNDDRDVPEKRQNTISNTKPVTTVLIVDDSPFNLMAASFLLEQFGYSTQKAFNGKECLELLEKSDRKYSIILTDIQMPILDGLEMSKIINQKIKKGETYYIPIVVLTALKLSAEDKKKYQQEYGIEYTLEKPLVPEKVRLMLKKLVLQRKEFCNK